MSSADHWVLSNLQHSQKKISADLDNFRFGEAYETLYHFVWDDLADWYVEASKVNPNKTLISLSFRQVLIISHPFAPFLTETIWQTLSWEKDSVLAARQSAKIINFDTKAAADFTEIQTIITEARFITKTLKTTDAALHFHDSNLVKDNSEIIKRLARLKSISEIESGDGIHLINTKQKVWLDIDKSKAKSYINELAEKRSRQQASIKQLKNRLSNKNYVQNAPKNVVEQTRQQLSDAEELLSIIEAEQKQFQL